MGAAAQFATAMPRSGPREGIDSSNDRKPAKGAGKPAAECSGSTARASGRCVLSEPDIEDALRWRLGGIPETMVWAVAERLLPFADDFREDRPEIATVLPGLRRVGDRRSPWSFAVAILADAAARRGDVRDYWRFGIEAVLAHRQAKRGSHDNHAQGPIDDALDELIATYLKADPEIAVDTLFVDFIAMAGGFHRTIADFDEDGDELVCQLTPDDIRLTNVDRNEFARRVEKMRARRARA